MQGRVAGDGEARKSALYNPRNTGNCAVAASRLWKLPSGLVAKAKFRESEY